MIEDDECMSVLPGGERIHKNSALSHLLCSIEELQVSLSFVVHRIPSHKKSLRNAQRNLMRIYDDVCKSSYGNSRVVRFSSEEYEKLEKEIERLCLDTPSTDKITLLGCSLTDSYIQRARIVSKSVENHVYGIFNINPDVHRYMNTLTEFLYCLGRYYIHKNEDDEIVM